MYTKYSRDAVDENNTALNKHIRKILAHLQSIKRMKPGLAEKMESVASEDFLTLYKKEYGQFYIKNATFIWKKEKSFFSEPVERRRIPAQFNNLESFNKEIKKIRAITNASEALKYQDAVFSSFFNSPDSHFLAFLIIELDLKIDALLVSQVIEKLQDTTNLQKPIEEYRAGDKEKDPRILWQNYLEFKSAILAAHLQIMPSAPELDKDNFMDSTPGSSRYGM
ncbi:hypothetical protein [Legionella micdadei]|uniref:Uncharacterized protein n=1 Tax=Legionella micdadei TaxID=451 RepID=A0A098GDH0_LEGMI|nr:hypothetical protein [Legionella micdadei]ARG98307.1 hypothetical protein B6N58_11895 [Legionella micdadei]ARH01058.1 hypothetical protein B6V88_11905 [Legionella micdadei]KTD27238.1 hypothetical protein Lmic_2173 [Legionella micdadei]CEG60022.1 protein of unknown function [Legionella micdadei]SCY61772.1 hypothetical protein SAMN02982997_02259 [Legionella micdadei]